MDLHDEQQVLASAVLETDGDGTLVMLLADLPEAMRFEGDPETAPPTSEAFGGAWFGAAHDGAPVLAFGLIELARADGASAVWYLPDPTPTIIATALDERHVVAVIPSEAPGVEAFGRDEVATVMLLEHATMVDVRHQSPSLAALVEARDADEHTSREELVDLDDARSVRAVLAPVRARLALSTGEVLTDEQIVPMAWRPWHYDLIEAEHMGGLLWQWPVIQVFFGLGDPAAIAFGGMVPPTPEQRRLLENYLIAMQRLARSLAVNSADVVRARWSPEREWSIDAVDAPHADALPALLATLRLLMDPTEGSQQSFNHIANALSAAAHAAGFTELVGEVKRWRKAHQQLLRRHLDELRHELAEELSGEQLGRPGRGPFSGAPEISPEQLLRTFMYGEALHRDEAHEKQIAEWDRDAIRGPTTLMEVRSDAQGLAHFYGGFAGYVARWLEVPAAAD